eukprot:1308578-Pyramimonas_sp.AAC.1
MTDNITDWFVVRICPCFLRPIGPSREQGPFIGGENPNHADCVLVRAKPLWGTRGAESDS